MSFGCKRIPQYIGREKHTFSLWYRDDILSYTTRLCCQYVTSMYSTVQYIAVHGVGSLRCLRRGHGSQKHSITWDSTVHLISPRRYSASTPNSTVHGHRTVQYSTVQGMGWGAYGVSDMDMQAKGLPRDLLGCTHGRNLDELASVCVVAAKPGLETKHKQMRDLLAWRDWRRGSGEGRKQGGKTTASLWRDSKVDPQHSLLGGCLGSIQREQRSLNTKKFT